MKTVSVAMISAVVRMLYLHTALSVIEGREIDRFNFIVGIALPTEGRYSNYSMNINVYTSVILVCISTRCFCFVTTILYH